MPVLLLTVLVTIFIHLLEMVGGTNSVDDETLFQRNEVCDRLVRLTETVCALNTLPVFTDYAQSETKFPLGHTLYDIAESYERF
ncbi:hypothetical protein EG68_00201 [Paragonimus skrjabini miyazakii]|uniref:Uncharacterized protein n=1 Tax=Paragonimus skrjabini miyazakii TaxID=59628 RepID=A0A8S9Z4V1_9TREM|nr:hypothetical protein EG68_00201 [Paragonimus skrjabini miyazakii]